MQQYAEQLQTHAGEGEPGGAAAKTGSLPMPTRAELLAAGRRDLVRAIAAAGGFLSVAQVRQIGHSPAQALSTASCWPEHEMKRDWNPTSERGVAG